MKKMSLNWIYIFVISIMFFACSEDCEYTSISTETLKEAKVGEKYSFKIELSNTCTPANRKVEIIEGSLPDGITLEADGEFTGTPKKAGTFHLKIKARVCFGSSGFEFTDCSDKTKEFDLIVKE